MPHTSHRWQASEHRSPRQRDAGLARRRAAVARRQRLGTSALALTLLFAAVLPARAGTGFRADAALAAQELEMWVAQAAQAAQEAQASGEEQAGVMQRMEDTLVRWQGILSGYVESMGEAVDRVFDPEIAFEEINQTSVRLRLDVDYEEGEDLDFSPNLSIRWVLPGANRRWSLLIGADSDGAADDEDVDAPLVDDEDNRASAALEFALRDDAKWRTSFSVGVNTDPQVFGRIRVRRNFQLTPMWSARIIDRLRVQSDDGWDNDFKVNFDRPFGRRLPDTKEFNALAVGGDRRPWLFRALSRVRWYEDRDGLFGQQRFSFFNRLSQRSAIAYEALAFGCTDPNEADGTEDCTEYDLRVRYRYVTKYPWLSFELWPTAAFPERNDYDFTAQLRFRMEIWFGRGPRVQGAGSGQLGEFFSDPDRLALR